jgi:Viral coat protein P2 N-terminal domain
MGYKNTLTNLQNVAPGNIATLKCPSGPGAPTYDQIALELEGGLTPAHIEWVRGKFNGRIFFDEGSGVVINDRADYLGIYNDATAVVLDFTNPVARNGAAEQLVSALPGALVQDLSFEIKLASNAPAGGRITAVANYRPPTANPFVRKMLSTSESFSAAGTEGRPNVIYVPNGEKAGGKILRCWIHEGVAGSITGAEIRIANSVMHTVTRARLERDQKRNERVPQTGIVVLDFIEDGNLAGLLDTIQSPTVELRLVTSQGDAYRVWYEFLDPVSRL